MRKKDPLKTIFIYLCTSQKQPRKLTCFLSNIMYTMSTSQTMKITSCKYISCSYYNHTKKAGLQQ